MSIADISTTPTERMPMITESATKTNKRVIRRDYRCTIRLTKGSWTVTTTARGTAGVVAQGTRRVVVR